MKKLGLFFSYGPTVAVVVLLILLAGGFLFWFQPRPVWAGAALAASLGLFILWFFMAVRSKDFARHLNARPGERDERSWSALLSKCHPEFRRSVEEVLALSERIRADFPQSGYEDDLNLMNLQLKELSQANEVLFQRSHAFGTAAQKTEMNALLKRQADAVKSQGESLKAFSGNLTLLEADSTPSAPSSELKYINQGLEDLIKEMRNA